jgi:hypothetical protein
VRAAWWHEQQDDVMDGFLVEPQNQGQAGTTWEPSHEWRLAEATPSSQGFRWFTRKPLGSLVDPKGKTEEPKTVLQQCQTGLTGVRQRSPESSKWRTRVEIARLASRLSRLRSPGIRPMEKASKTAIEGLVSVVGRKGYLDFRLPPYNPRGERMAAKP